jgi:hypothetical protein
VTLDELERLDSRMKPPFLSLERALDHLRAITWENQLLSRLRLGQQEILRHLDKPVEGEKLARILDPRGGLVALVEWLEDVPQGRWRLIRYSRHSFGCVLR